MKNDKSPAQVTCAQLAAALGTTRTSIKNWRKLPGNPKKNDPDEWLAFIKARGLGQFSTRLNAPLPKTAAHDELSEDERALRLRERKLRVQREEFELQKAQDKMFPLAQFQAALADTIAAFNAALNALPGRASDNIHKRFRSAAIATVRGALTEKQFEKIEPTLDTATMDYSDVQEILEIEVERIKRDLAAAKFIKPDPESD